MSEPTMNELPLSVEKDETRPFTPNSGGYGYATMLSKIYLFLGVLMMILGLLGVALELLGGDTLNWIVLGISTFLLVNGFASAALGQFMLAQIDVAKNTREILKAISLNLNLHR